MSVYLQQNGLENDYAGFWRRFGALLIDIILMNIISFFVGFGVGLVIGVLTAVLFHGDRNMAGMATIMSALISIVCSIVLYWLYEAFLLSMSGQTLGKKALGIRVVTLQGNNLTFLHATGRHFARMLCGLTISLGYLMTLFTERKQGLHDLVAQTVVIKD